MVGIEKTSGYGDICYSKNGDKCYSLKEKEITDFFIEHGIRYEKEKKYSEIIPSVDTKIRMDWYLIDYLVVVEYFGLSSLQKKLEKYNEKIKMKIQTCENNNIPIISIFEKDTKNLNKFFKNRINIQSENL